MTKKLFTFCLVLFIAATTSAQTDKENIENTFKMYLAASEKMDFETVLDYVYPKLFEIASREKMMEAMNSVFDNPTFTVAIKNSKLLSVTDIYELDGAKYALVKYSFTMTFTFTEDESEAEDSTETEPNQAEITAEMFKEKFGKDNVFYKPGSNIIDINMSTAMYAINDPAYKGWKFIEKKEDRKELLEKLLPKKVLKKF